MSMVDYGSSSEEESTKEESKTNAFKGLKLPAPKRSGSGGPVKITVDKPKLDAQSGVTEQPKAKGGLASMLPAPKNRVKENVPETTVAAPLSRQKKTLGGGIKGQFDGEIKVEEYYGSSSNDSYKTKSVKIVPASVLARQAKYGKVEPQPPAAGAARETISVPNEVKPKPKAKQMPSLFTLHQAEHAEKGGDEEEEEEHAQSVQKFDPLPEPEESGDEDGNENENENTNERSVVDIGQLEGGRKGKRKHIQIVDVDMNEFYANNDELRAKGLLQQETQGKVHTIGSGRHQLSSVITSAQQNKESLEQQFNENKRRKAESRQRFGF